jgi:hypothetical protein
MSIFKELAKQYNEIDTLYSAKEFEAINKGWYKKEAEYQRKRELNDQSYFLFMFSRLEDRIKNLSNTLITNKKNSISSWKQRAPWDILPTGSNSRVSFKNKVALLIDKRSNDYDLIVEYYKERNSIAHGGAFITPVIMPDAINNFKRLYSVLKY